MRTLLKPVVAIPVGIVVVLALAAGLYLFQPWRLFTTVEVVEAVPTSASDLAVSDDVSAAPPTVTEQPGATPSPSESATPAPVDPIVLVEGSFISHEHETTGRVRILELADGTRVLRIEGLSTSDGPDLKVWLSDQPVIDGVDGWGVFDDGAYLSLGDLKGNVGDQNYAIPDDVEIGDFGAVSIWCERFAVSFGAAELLPA